MQPRSGCHSVARDSKIIDALKNPIGNADKVLVLWVLCDVIASAPDVWLGRFSMIFGSIGRQQLTYLITIVTKTTAMITQIDPNVAPNNLVPIWAITAHLVYT